jgi:hypothetical protein
MLPAPLSLRPPRRALELDLPENGVRLRLRVGGDFLFGWTAASLALLGLGGAVALSGAGPGETVAAVGVSVFGLLAGLAAFGRLRRRLRAEIVFDRRGIHDRACGLPPLEWADVERLEVADFEPGDHTGEKALYARIGDSRVRLAGTRESGLPVPFEYLVDQLHRRGAPVRAPAAGFDPLEQDARWLPVAHAARLLAGRLGARALPFAGHRRDIALTRRETVDAAHWHAVIAELRRQDGLVAAED